jgi:flagellar biosynthetic protein FliQ
MTPDAVVALGMDAGRVALLIGGPILLAGLLAGLAVSIFQAVTQIQDGSLAFLPKVAATLAVLALLGHWMLGQLVGFTTGLLANLAAFAR